MTDFSGIRLRCEESRGLHKGGSVEAALILALVAVAAASRVRGFIRGWATTSKGQPADRKWFIDYLVERSHEEYAEFNEPMADIVYRHFRCELIHEATSTKQDFGLTGSRVVHVHGPGSFVHSVGGQKFFSIVDGRMEFGPGLALAICDLVEFDRDLLSLYPERRKFWKYLVHSPFDQAIRSRVEQVLDCTDDEAEALICVLETFGPEAIQNLDRKMFNTLWEEARSAKFAPVWKQGIPLALQHYGGNDNNQPPLFSSTSQGFSEVGFKNLRIVAGLFKEIDPPDLSGLTI